jgi:two-component system nitrogen regulation response regulator NtrX
MAETILVVDDEEPVQKTFREWLQGANLDCEVLAAGDAATALTIANQRPIDLAILDWNLGAGNNGLQLLEDLYVFNPDVVAIMITGYAHQATPLDAMRMGVRDYLDKNQELNRDKFLAVVRKQLERIRPAKRERRLQRGLAQFRDSVEKVLPLVRTAAAVNDPVPFTDSVRSLFRFLLRSTSAKDGVLIVRSYYPDRQPAENYRAYSIEGQTLSAELVPFSRSLAGTVLSMQEPCVMSDLDKVGQGAGAQLQPFERGRRNLLAAPLVLAPGLNVVLELFDRPGGFGDAERRLVGASAEFGAELIKQALAERETQGMLADAVQAALEASDAVSQTLNADAHAEVAAAAEPPPAAVLEKLKESLQRSPLGLIEAEQSLKLAELLREIAVRHGPEATQSCVRLLQTVHELLDTVTGSAAIPRLRHNPSEGMSNVE